MGEKDVSRRSFLQILMGAAIVLPATFAMRKLFALNLKTLPKGQKSMDEKAPMAAALGFKHDASKVDSNRFKKYKAGQLCSNCAQFTKINDNWGECKIIRGGLVSPGGWCNSFLEKKPVA